MTQTSSKPILQLLLFFKKLKNQKITLNQMLIGKKLTSGNISNII